MPANQAFALAGFNRTNLGFGRRLYVRSMNIEVNFLI